MGVQSVPACQCVVSRVLLALTQHAHGSRPLLRLLHQLGHRLQRACNHTTGGAHVSTSLNICVIHAPTSATQQSASWRCTTVPTMCQTSGNRQPCHNTSLEYICWWRCSHQGCLPLCQTSLMETMLQVMTAVAVHLAVQPLCGQAPGCRGVPLPHPPSICVMPWLTRTPKAWHCR